MGPSSAIFSGLQLSFLRPFLSQPHSLPSSARCFSTSKPASDWLVPKMSEKSKSRKGRPRMATGGSTRGTTVVWGDYGLRMRDHDRRISAAQLKIGMETINRRLRGMDFKLYTRVSANIGVYTSGNEQRMGKGKGKFDYWAARVPVSRIIFELKGNLHEKVAREAFRLAAHKLPGLYEFVKKGEPAVVGITKLSNGVTLESLKRARREITSPVVSEQPSPPTQNAAP
ncbi:50S ribosomal protein L16 [Coccidioides immitis H538.4]|uniref:50S ribosomal protein L16 n=2 Tax=Coccidioides immitis TaxID=5501 RepID=A0A0J8S586_COCIT|nr:50S ribosomal protein L16 [Coccidioides immitis RMSCC 2394]KMU92322.1 50S ribosomal protein L16 [Coccidioides immitis H538.4]TPX21741.1 mitochondrial ribosomal large subunit component [Coccidioides immitis]